ncbi:MAG: hypothetical protein ACYDBS_04590, partial [Acidimicrobiales bacterium]
MAHNERGAMQTGQCATSGQVPSDLIYDWNEREPRSASLDRPSVIEFNDETLRDGLQCPSVLQPSLQEKKRFLRLLPLIGIGSADIGYAGASSATFEDVVELARTVSDEHLGIKVNCAGRTHID